MPSIADLKKNRSVTLDKAKAVLEKTQAKERTQYKDDRFWYPKTDKAGNALAIIRFLPPLDAENDDPYISFYEHNFKGPNGYYKANCLTSLGKNDPVQEFIKKHGLWDGSAEDKALARLMTRKQTFIANIYVVKDVNNPENNGKVFLYRFGQQIVTKISSAMRPEFDGDVEIDPFDLWDKGANLRLKVITRQDGKNNYPNYEQSQFESPAPLFPNDPGDKKLEAAWKQVHDLKQFLVFKKKDELQAMLDEVMGTSEDTDSDTPVEDVVAEEPEAPKQNRAKSVAERISKSKAPVEETVSSFGDDDDELASLQKMADELSIDD